MGRKLCVHSSRCNDESEKTMNFIERFQSLWQVPSPKELAAKELEEAKRRFLDAQSGMEYAKRMSDYHADRIKRLTNYLESAE